MSTKETVFLTGGAGFIGTNLARHYLNKGFKVVAYDALYRNALQYFEDVSNHSDFTLIKGDILDIDHLRENIGNPDYVIHLASMAGVSKIMKNPVDVMRVTILGTFNVLEVLKDKKNLKAFVDFSTSEIYGSNCFNALEEGNVKMENLSEKRWTYATAKISSEKIGMAYYWQFGIPFIGVRPFNVYGPGQVGEGVLSYFINNALRGETLHITGDGAQCRTMCHIEDFVHGIDVLLNNLDKSVGESFNVGRTEEIVSVYSLAKLIEEIHGSDLKMEFVEHFGEDVRCRAPSTQKLKDLGYRPQMGLKDGIRTAYNWYKEHSVNLD